MTGGGSIARTLSLLPVGDTHRAEYLQNYLDMVKAIVPLQRADGYWNVSLHDSTHFGGKELTGTALFTYGIAWGIPTGCWAMCRGRERNPRMGSR